MADKFDAKASSDTAAPADQPTRAKRSIPTILHDEPLLSPPAALLMREHRTGWKRDYHIADPSSGAAPNDDAAEVQRYYEWMAGVDPSSATGSKYAFNLAPMPVGGLDVLVKELLPDGSDDENKRLKELLFRMNSDKLRTDDRYVPGAMVRVPSERTDVLVD